MKFYTSIDFWDNYTINSEGLFEICVDKMKPSSNKFTQKINKLTLFYVYSDFCNIPIGWT